MPPKKVKPRGGQNKVSDRAIEIILDGHKSGKKPRLIAAALEAESIVVHRNTIAKYRGAQRVGETKALRNRALVKEAVEAPLDGSHNYASRLPTAERCRAAVAATHRCAAVRESAGSIGARAAQKGLAPHRRIWEDIEKCQEPSKPQQNASA